MEGYQQGSGRGREDGENGGKGSGVKKHNWQVKTDGDVKNRSRNGEAKELICMTHRHELRGSIARENGEYRVEEGKGG